MTASMLTPAIQGLCGAEWRPNGNVVRASRSLARKFACNAEDLVGAAIDRIIRNKWPPKVKADVVIYNTMGAGERMVENVR